MYSNKNTVIKGLVLGVVLSNSSIGARVDAIEEYSMLKMDRELYSSNKVDSKKGKKSKGLVKVNKNIRVGTVLNITVGDGEYIPDLTGNPEGYETVEITTVGSKKLVEMDYDNLRNSGIPRVNLSNAFSDSVPYEAFRDADYLSEFKFPRGLTYIGNSAFYGCSGLIGNLVIPDGVTSIGWSAFEDCSGLRGNLVIPDTVTSIGSYAFRGCSGLTGGLVIPSGVTRVGDSVFEGCSGFTGSLIIPIGVTSIGNSAFEGCSGFTGSLIMPAGVTNIGHSAFRGCSGFTGSLVIPDSMINIGDFAFKGCSGFTGSLVISDSVINIGDSVFYGCSGFTGSLVIPDSVISIGNSAFYGCSGFTGSLVISKSVTSIGASVFDGCNGFTGDLVIPTGVTSVGDSAFYECSGFTGSLVMPDSVTSIGGYAFRKCSGLTGSLVIPDSVVSVGDYAFRGCSGFVGNLVIPGSVTSVGDSAFNDLSGVEKILIKINKEDESTNYRKAIIDNLPDTSQIMIDVPYGFDVSGSWIEATSRTLGEPVIKNVIDGVESDLINNKGEVVSLYIPSLYQESNITVMKDGKISVLPVKDINEKYIFTELGVYQVTLTTDLGNTSVIDFEVEDLRFKEAEEAVEKAEASKDSGDIEYARDLVNKLPECIIKDQLQDRLDEIFPNMPMNLKTVSSNVDLYIQSQNALSLSLDTNSVAFDNFSGVEDMETPNAVNLTVSSSLPYRINAYLPTDITGARASAPMDKSILNIRANGGFAYQTFVDLVNPIILLDDQSDGNNRVHGIDLMLKGNIAHEKDVYKATIKFEVEQK